MKHKKDLRFIVLGTVFLFLISACSTQQETGAAPKTPFLGGTAGLDINFLEESPPNEVTDQNSFPFQAVVSIKNNGETDVLATGAKISLVGFFPSLFGANAADLSNKQLTEDLKGRQRDSEGNIIESVQSFVTFPTDATQFNFVGSIAGNTMSIFRADVCYKYQTRATSEICVLENQIDVAKDALCKPSEPKTIFSSSSPIQVGSFKQNVVGKDKMQFSFDLVHSGQGYVFDPAVAADCPKDPTVKRMKQDNVNIGVKTGIGTAGQLKCVGLSDQTVAGQTNGTVKLINGKRSITCTQELPPQAQRTDFKKPVDITIDFNYLASKDKEVLVKHLIN